MTVTLELHTTTDGPVWLINVPAGNASAVVEGWLSGRPGSVDLCGPNGGGRWPYDDITGIRVTR